MPVRRADDVVDVLLSQHEQLRQLLADVLAAPGDDQKRLFGELADVLSAHEHGEQIVVHPAVRDKHASRRSGRRVLPNRGGQH